MPHAKVMGGLEQPHLTIICVSLFTLMRPWRALEADDGVGMQIIRERVLHGLWVSLLRPNRPHGIMQSYQFVHMLYSGFEADAGQQEE
jgi:hypothetical protein